MPPRETHADRVDREWRELSIGQLEELGKQIHALQLEIAIIKVKFGIAMLALGTASSVLTTIVVQMISKGLKLP